MEIVLKILALKNFKGVKNLEIDFDKVTSVYGGNATGKTTINDAFTWLLFDKDSQDRTTFEIKTLDKHNNVIHGLEHRVAATLEVDGHPLDLCKIYKEKWVKRRGEAERKLDGHETLYYINEVPVKKGEYQDKINSLINESVFKLITNPLYFSTNMKWQDRRKTLMDIIGDVTTDRVINYKANLKPLEELLKETDIDTFKKTISARRKRLNDDLKGIPLRIDECNNSIKDIDFSDLEFKKNTLIPAIRSLENQLIDKSKVNDEVIEFRKELNALKNKLVDIEYNAQVEAEKPLRIFKEQLREVGQKKSNKQYELKEISNYQDRTKREIANIKLEIEREDRSRVELRARWNEENKKQFIFDETLGICPTCKRAYENGDIENTKSQLLENFNKNKATTLDKINKQGKEISKKIEELNKKLQDISNMPINNTEPIEAEIKRLSDEWVSINDRVLNFSPSLSLENNQDYTNTIARIEELEKKLKAPTDAITDELKAKKRGLESELEDINRQLSLKDHNENMKIRINELMEDEKRISQQIAELEGQEFMCEEYVKTKVELLEGTINNKFKYVSFKLFNDLVNGGIEECCEALIEGVPFSNANNAAKINAGLDIINTLSTHYDTRATIFIDNREGVNKIIETNSQVINLIVSQDKTLRVESEA